MNRLNTRRREENVTYPQHVRLQAIRIESQAIGEFLDWLADQGIVLAVPDTNTPALPPCWHLPIQESHESLLARLFGIDLCALEAEKRAMLLAAQTQFEDG